MYCASNQIVKGIVIVTTLLKYECRYTSRMYLACVVIRSRILQYLSPVGDNGRSSGSTCVSILSLVLTGKPGKEWLDLLNILYERKVIELKMESNLGDSNSYIYMNRRLMNVASKM